MKRALINELKENEKSKISGFIENLRDKRSMQFVVIKDISGKIQITVEKEKTPEIAEVFSSLQLQSVVTLTGVMQKNEFVKLNGKEFIADSIIVESSADVNPISEDSSIDHRMDYRWIDLRSDKNLLLFKVQSCFVNAMREFLIKNKFIEIHTPKIIGTESESGAGVFEVKYFDTKAFLAQSPQFYKQMAMAGGFERIFETGPVFRAEQSFTNRHATEFSGFDIEFSYIESYRDVMKMEEDLLVFAFRKVKEQYGQQIKDIFGVDIVVPSQPFPQMKLADVYAELESRYGYFVPEKERGDLTTEGEKLCAQLAMEKFNHEFLFITDYNAKNRAFYHMRQNGVPQGYDLIFKGVEITTGAQREHRYDVLKQQANEKGLEKDVEFYLEFFRYGCPPHGGFGLGIDRITMLLLNLSTIKESMFLFRGPNRLKP